MRSCLHAHPVRKLNSYVSPVSIASRKLNLRLRQKPLAAPQQYQQQRTMNVAAAAVPALNAALAGVSIGVFAAWLDARLKSRCDQAS